MTARGVAAVIVGVAIVCAAGAARAETRAQLLIVGNNQSGPETADGERDESLPTLRYADDDAAAIYELLEGIADTAHLLTVMDSETQAKFPNLAGVARPPTMTELRGALASIEQRIESNQRRGDKNVVYLFFSGHGAVRAAGGPALVLLDGDLSHDILYEEILNKLKADYVHLLVDACHAEGVVRPRDTGARQVTVSAADADAFLVHSTLARFPHVGAIVAATTDAQAHEWDQLGHGVFTSEVLSSLRGAADVNHDRRIEYSEVAAFLAAANRSVHDPRARLSVVARPPALDRHAALIDLAALPKVVRLAGVAAGQHLIEVEDGSGRRLVTLRGEVGFVADLVVPPGSTYVRVDHREAWFDGRPGAVVAFGTLAFEAPRMQQRGALEDALRRGLFGSEFGLGYYNGFTDQAADFAAVTFGRSPSGPGATVATAERGRDPSTQSLELAVGLGVSTTVAQMFSASPALRLALRSLERSGPTASLDLAWMSRDGLAEGQVIASFGWSWTRRFGRARGWLGGAMGGGFIEQRAERRPLVSGVLAASPRLGGAIGVTRNASVWLEGEVSALIFRADGQAALGLRPSVLAGASLAY